MKELLIGAHMSIAGGVHNALLGGKEIGATTIQLFTANQRQWKGKKISKEEIALWDEALEKTQMKKVMSHDNYLINLGSSKKALREKSLIAFKEEIERCHLLKIPYLNFHPGSSVESSEEECLKTIVKSLISCSTLLSRGDTIPLIECTAGQGSQVGYNLEQLAFLVEHLKKEIPIGITIDTCHFFTAGYDIRTKEGFDSALKEFDKFIGLSFLKAIHANDSLYGLGSRRDRHANLGKGMIGLECFRYLMTDKKTRDLPKYLETPSGEVYWVDEIQLLKDLAYAHKD